MRGIRNIWHERAAQTKNSKGNTSGNANANASYDRTNSNKTTTTTSTTNSTTGHTHRYQVDGFVKVTTTFTPVGVTGAGKSTTSSVNVPFKNAILNTNSHLEKGRQ